MKRPLLPFAALLVAASAFGAELARPLDKANVLPLALEDGFEFRKTKLFLNDPDLVKVVTSERMIAFERERIRFGAVTGYDERQRRGHYLSFFWRTKREADLTVRLEYRQANLGSYVQAKEIEYKGVKGSRKTEFQIIGDDYREDGRITAWRALLIEKGRIVALNQSFLWN
ncbi:MAG: hypothetical protein M3463_18725 [Verrucomicrobiota bacterium]|nr:hypothetical protein [Verrucomicrobiota bacterium]